MSQHEYQDVTIKGVRPEGNRAGITPTHPDLAPFFAEGWRVNRHTWLDGGQCRVELFRPKAEEHAAGGVDVRTAAERAQDEAHLAKIRAAAAWQAEAAMAPAAWREQWLAGALDNLPPAERVSTFSDPLCEPPAAPYVMAGAAAWDRWLLEFGAWLQAAPIEPETRERVADAAMVVAGTARNLAGLLTAIARPQVLPATADTWASAPTAASGKAWDGAAAARAIWASTDPDTGRPAIEQNDTAARKARGLA